MLARLLKHAPSSAQLAGARQSTAQAPDDAHVLARLLKRDPQAPDDAHVLAGLLKRDLHTAQDAQMLAYLLEHLPPPAMRPVRQRPATRLRQYLGHRPWAYAVAAVLLLGVLFGGLMLGRTALALFTIRQNLQAMQVQVPTTTPTSSTDSQSIASPSPQSAIPSATASQGTRVASASSTFAPVDITVAAQSPADSSSTATSTTLPTLTPLPTDVIIPPEILPSGMLPIATASALGAQESVGTNDLQGEQAINVLLLGIDQRPGETYAARADAIMVARLDPNRERIALLSLNRDLIVEIPGYGWARINAANAHGEITLGEGGGIDLTRRTVSNLLGIPIDYVVQMNFQGFIGAIDAIGGVTINVKEELYDPRYPTMDYGYTEAHFLPGPQHMDGERALMYSRVRHMDSDFERLRRQQVVMVSVLERVREQHALNQVQQMAGLTTALRDYIRTDMSPERMVNLAWTFRNFEPDMVERYALNANMVQQNVIPGDPYATIALPGTIETLVQQLVEGPGSAQRH
jgi:LCP family protein required for cell wall assembly